MRVTLAHVFDASTNKKTDYIGKIARITNGNVTYLHFEPLPWPSARILDPPDQKLATLPAPKHLGSASSGTDASGAIAWNEQYTPFGETILNPAANDNLDGFTGHIKDKATGLNYMQARYYDPALGRFLSIDPVGFTPDQPFMFNRYTYVGNDPINAIDPDGNKQQPPPRTSAIHKAQQFGKGLGAALGGLMNSGPGRDIVSITEPVILNNGDAMAYTAGALSGTALVSGLGSGASATPALITQSLKQVTKPATQNIIAGFTKHGIDQVINRGVKPASLLDAVKTPLKVGKIKIDSKGLPSQRFTGEKASVVVNPETRKVVTVNPTSTKRAKKLRETDE